MGRKLDIESVIGVKYNRYTILGDSTEKKHRQFVSVQCDCGTIKNVDYYKLRTGHTKSCGCFKLEKTAEMGRNTKTHGMKGTSEYQCYQSMKHRCYNENSEVFHHYGGRGIGVSDSWLEGFENFFSDMGLKSTPDLSLERRDNNLGYSKENCYWGTKKQQSQNTRTTKLNPELIPQIIDLSNKGFSSQRIINTLGLPVSETCIDKVRNRETWENISNLYCD